MKKLEKRNPEQPRKCRVGTQTKSVILRRRVSADEGTDTLLDIQP